MFRFVPTYDTRRTCDAVDNVNTLNSSTHQLQLLPFVIYYLIPNFALQTNEHINYLSA